MCNTLLRSERLRHRWAQQQLADFAGISLSTVERAEKGASIRIDFLLLILISRSRLDQRSIMSWFMSSDVR